MVDQAEFATDVLFRDRASLAAIYPRLLQHATLCLSAEDVLRFLGRKLSGCFAGEVLNDCKKRWPGARVKHRMKGNWIKMYDKHGLVLRIETVINNPTEFRVRRWGQKKGQQVLDWFPLRKGVANLWRYAEVSLQADRRYLEALAVVEGPAPEPRQLERICEPAQKDGRRWRGLNPLRRQEQRLFAVVLRGEYAVRGFRNRDMAERLYSSAVAEPGERRRRCARVSRLLRTHGLIAKFPRSRCYHVTAKGQALMSAALRFRQAQRSLEPHPGLARHPGHLRARANVAVQDSTTPWTTWSSRTSGCRGAARSRRASATTAVTSGRSWTAATMSRSVTCGGMVQPSCSPASTRR